MDFGLHLPLMDFGGNPFTLDHLIAYTESGRELGFRALAANDHLVYSKPWLDGPTALAAILSHSGHMDLATTVSLPIVRGPVRSPNRWAPLIDSPAGASSPALDRALLRAITLQQESHLSNAGIA